MDAELEKRITSEIEGCVPDLLDAIGYMGTPAFEGDLKGAQDSIYDFAGQYMHDHFSFVPREERLALATKLSKLWV